MQINLLRYYYKRFVTTLGKRQLRLQPKLSGVIAIEREKVLLRVSKTQMTAIVVMKVGACFRIFSKSANFTFLRYVAL